MIFSGKTASRAQANASGAGTLIIVIALAIFLYITFLPPDARKALLEDNATGTSTSVAEADQNKTLLLEHPGTLDYLSEKNIQKNIPNIKLFSDTVPETLKAIQFINPTNAWFNNQPAKYEFTIDDLDNINNILISANVKDAKGSLIIKVNNQIIYNKEVKGGNIEPLAIPKDILSKSNSLEIGVSGVGAAFWKTNQYSLENIKITADHTDISTLKSKNTFLVSSTENSNLDNSVLKFFIYCARNFTKKMDVSINGHNVYSQVPDCDSRVILPFSTYYLSSGENSVEFSTDSGKYTLDRVSVDIELKDVSNPVYYFEIKPEQMAKIDAGEKDVKTYMKFVDGITKKEADLIFNGHMTSLDSKDSTFERSIKQYVEEGTNGIKIVPRASLEITELKVVYE